MLYNLPREQVEELSFHHRRSLQGERLDIGEIRIRLHSRITQQVVQIFRNRLEIHGQRERERLELQVATSRRLELQARTRSSEHGREMVQQIQEEPGTFGRPGQLRPGAETLFQKLAAVGLQLSLGLEGLCEASCMASRMRCFVMAAAFLILSTMFLEGYSVSCMILHDIAATHSQLHI